MAKRKSKRKRMRKVTNRKTRWGTKPSREATQQAKRAAAIAREQERKAKRRTQEVEPPVIELRTLDRYRSRRTGKIVPFSQRKGAIRERVQVQVDQKGRVIRTTGFNTKEEVRRTVLPGMVHQSGPYQGLIGRALESTNVMSPSSLRGARKILIKVSGTDPRGERATFKVDIDQQTIKKRRRVLRSVMLGTILYEMRRRSWRSWYRINQVDWTKKHHISRSRVEKMVPMRDMEIVVRVLK